MIWVFHHIFSYSWCLKSFKISYQKLSTSALLKDTFWYTFQTIRGLDDFDSDNFSSEISMLHLFNFWKWLMTLMWSTDENQNEDQKMITELIIDIEKLLMTIDFSENIENLNSIWSGTDLPLIWSIFQMFFDHVTVVHILDNDKSCFLRFWCKSTLKKKWQIICWKKNKFLFVLHPRILMVFVNGIRFTDGKKIRHDDDMEFDQVVLEYVDTWRRSIVIRKDSTKTRMKTSWRSWLLYFGYFQKIEKLTNNVIDHWSYSERVILSLSLSLVLTKISRYLTSRCHSFPQKKIKIPNRYQRIECPTQDRKFHQVIKNEVVQFCISMNFNTFKNIHIYICICFMQKIWIF